MNRSILYLAWVDPTDLQSHRDDFSFTLDSLFAFDRPIAKSGVARGGQREISFNGSK